MVHADAFGVRKTNVQPMIDAVNESDPDPELLAFESKIANLLISR
jgi:hypothetical protein